jgi:tetratricopeptide (TPR) repeat protein
VDSGNTISRQDELAVLFSLTDLPESLWREGRARITLLGLKGEDASKREIEILLTEQPHQRIMRFYRAVPATDLAPDYYEAVLAVVDGKGETFLESRANFIVAATESVSHPVTLVWPTPQSMRHLLFYGLAYQYDSLARPERAEDLYEKALVLDPAYTRGIAEYADFLVRAGKFDKALAVVERVGDDESLKFQSLLVKGLANMGKKEYETAIPLFLEANRIYNSDVRLLNALGMSYDRIGKKKEALDVLDASLRLNPGQKDIRDLVNRIRTEIK